MRRIGAGGIVAAVVFLLCAMAPADTGREPEIALALRLSDAESINYPLLPLDLTIAVINRGSQPRRVASFLTEYFAP